MWDYFKAPDFNTSHVTVYLMPKMGKVQAIAFQYISCYCLSRNGRIREQAIFISIHLMLLFIDADMDKIRPDRNFNTSHVTVYRGTSILL